MKWLLVILALLSSLAWSQTKVSVGVTGTITHDNWGIAAVAYKCPTCAFVQECHNLSFASPTSCTLSGVGANHTLVIGMLTCFSTFCNTTSGDGLTPSDTFASTWTSDARLGFGGGNGYPVTTVGSNHQSGIAQIWSTNTGVNTGSNTITVTLGNPINDYEILAVVEFSNMPSVSPVDGVMVGDCGGGDCSYVAGNTLDTNIITITQKDMIFAIYQNGVGNGAFNPYPTGLTGIFFTAGGTFESAAYGLVTPGVKNGPRSQLY